MPRYYFNLLHHDAPAIPDDEGMELQDDAAAKHEAMESLRDLIAESVCRELEPVRVSIEVVRDKVGVIARLTGQLAFQPQS